MRMIQATALLSLDSPEEDKSYTVWRFPQWLNLFLRSYQTFCSLHKKMEYGCLTLLLVPTGM